MTSVKSWDTPVGPISSVWREGKLHRLEFKKLSAASTPPEGVDRLGEQLQEYFVGKRRAFTVPVEVEGTAFQKRVWAALLKIPYGQTRTYAEIASEIGCPRAQRAVGNAVGKNPLPIIVPCHRVIRSDGSLGGFSGGPGIKPRLLRLESKI